MLRRTDDARRGRKEDRIFLTVKPCHIIRITFISGIGQMSATLLEENFGIGTRHSASGTARSTQRALSLSTR